MIVRIKVQSIIFNFLPFSSIYVEWYDGVIDCSAGRRKKYE